MPRRYDYGELKARQTSEGFLIDSPIVARTGILTYRNPDGSERKELRLPEDVFHADSLASFKGKPITVNHPKGLVNKSNVKSLSIGTILAANRQDGDLLASDIVIHEPDRIGENRELSLGYDVDLDETPGIYNGERYDAIQRNIRVNHLSVVKRARAGAVARLNMDSDEEIETVEPKKDETKMAKVRLDSGIEYEAPPEVAAAFEKMRADAKVNSEALAAKTGEVSTLQGQKDTLQARVDGFPEELKKATDAAADKLRADAEERSNIETVAKAFKIDCKDKSNKDLKIAVITAANKAFKADGKDDAYINAAYDMASTMRVDAAMASQRVAVTQGTQGKQQEQQRTDAKDPQAEWLASMGSNGTKSN